MLYLPENLPIAARLREDGWNVGEYRLSEWRNCPKGTLRVLLLNLMPQKEVTELDLARMMVHEDVDVWLVPMKISGQTYMTTPMEHMERFYLDFEHLASACHDGLVITGAPLEHLPFEEVRYWRQLGEIMDWSLLQVKSKLYICWAAQAGLYHFYGIPKYPLSHKMFGVYSQQVCRSGCPLLEGLGDAFPMPNSRHTEVRIEDFPVSSDLSVVACSEVSGVGVAVSASSRNTYIVGHLEYEPLTLHNEYVRDLNKGLPIRQPENYYLVAPDLEHGRCGEVNFSWKQTARAFYRNWLASCQ